jgi:hypothetical protein
MRAVAGKHRAGFVNRKHAGAGARIAKRQCGEVVERQLGTVGKLELFPIGIAGNVAADSISP